MDVTKELAAKANFGDEKAIAELRLTNMATIEFSALNEVTKDRLERIFTICAKAAIAGKVLGLECIKVSALNVMGLTQLLATAKLKCKLRYSVDKDDVYKRMDIISRDRRNWLEKLGETKEGKVYQAISWLENVVAYARQGDDESQELLNLRRLPSIQEKIKVPKSIPGYSSLFVEFKRGCELAADTWSFEPD